MAVVLKEEYRTAGARTDKDPLETFVRNNVRHPEMDCLLLAVELGDDYCVERIMWRSSADG